MYFIDTSYWIALALERDAYHDSALAWETVVAVQPDLLVTTEAVLWETLNSLSSIVQRSLAAELYRRVHDDPAITVVEFKLELCDQAVRLYADRSDKTWSIVDCLSFVVMQDRGIRQALTSDHHFEQAGFEVLLRRQT